LSTQSVFAALASMASTRLKDRSPFTARTGSREAAQHQERDGAGARISAALLLRALDVEMDRGRGERCGPGEVNDRFNLLKPERRPARFRAIASRTERPLGSPPVGIE
jgi:hypothetical protein